MSERLIMGLTGSSGTGKTSAAKFLEEEHGFTVFEGSNWTVRKPGESIEA